MERNSIPSSQINHLGWVGNDIDLHIKELERQEKQASMMRSSMRLPQISNNQVTPAPEIAQHHNPFNKPQISQEAPSRQQYSNPLIDNEQSTGLPKGTPPNPWDTNFPPKEHGGTNYPEMPFVPSPSNTPQPGYGGFPPNHNIECTQGELGLEGQVKYSEDFEKELEELKKGFQLKEKDPNESINLQEARERERATAQNFDNEFLKALNDLKLSAAEEAKNVKPQNFPDGVNRTITTSGFGGVHTPFAPPGAKIPPNNNRDQFESSFTKIKPSVVNPLDSYLVKDPQTPAFIPYEAENQPQQGLPKNILPDTSHQNPESITFGSSKEEKPSKEAKSSSQPTHQTKNLEQFIALLRKIGA